MNKINFVVVGKIKESFYREAVAEYVKRLSRFAKVEMKEIAEGVNLETEADAILRAVKGYAIVLAVEGKKASSEQLAARLGELIDEGKEITFVIGSSCGLSDRVKAACDLRLSVSALTFPHQMMRVMLLEILYRCFNIQKGTKYHK